MTRFEYVRLKFLNDTAVHVELSDIQITRGVNQCTTCKRTTEHDSTNHGVYLLNCFGHVIYPAINEHVRKYCKNLNSLKYNSNDPSLMERRNISIYLYLYEYFFL